MSGAHAYSQSLEQDVCVICDGECTCEISESTAPAPYVPPPSTPAPPLKIKLTVPPGLFARPVPAASTSSSVISPQKKTTKATISPYANKAPHPPPRKRGRPPKALAAAYAAQVLHRLVRTLVKTTQSSIRGYGNG